MDYIVRLCLNLEEPWNWFPLYHFTFPWPMSESSRSSMPSPTFDIFRFFLDFSHSNSCVVVSFSLVCTSLMTNAVYTFLYDLYLSFKSYLCILDISYLAGMLWILLNDNIMHFYWTTKNNQIENRKTTEKFIKTKRFFEKVQNWQTLKKTKKKEKIIEIINKRQDITMSQEIKSTSEIKRIIRCYYEQLYANKLDSLE